MRNDTRTSNSSRVTAATRNELAAEPRPPARLPAWLPRALPFALFIAALALRSLLEAPLQAAGFSTHWLYALQVVPAAAALAVLWRSYVELADRPAPVALALSAGAGIIVFVLWINLTEPWMRLGEPATSFVPVDASGGLLWPQILLRTAGAVVLVPLVEELFWRSFLMRWIDRRDFLSVAARQVSVLAIVTSSAVFALGHDLWLAGIVAGLAYAFIYVLTGNLWNAVAAHAVTNLMLAIWVVQQGRWEFW